jgi:hypothetical protein
LELLISVRLLEASPRRAPLTPVWTAVIVVISLEEQGLVEREEMEMVRASIRTLGSCFSADNSIKFNER